MTEPFNNESYPDPLEKIFLRVEAESERRAQKVAQDEARKERHSRPGSSHSIAQRLEEKAAKTRRRGSISISKFGQLSVEDQLTDYSASAPTSPRLSTLASHSTFYQAQAANLSTSSFASGDSQYEGADIEHDHVTQMLSIAPKQSISKAVSSKLLPRRLSRVQSANVIRANPSPVYATVQIKETSTSIEASHGVTRSGSLTTEIVGGGRRRMTVSGNVPTIITQTSAPPLLASASSTGTLRSTTSSLSTSSREKDKPKSIFRLSKTLKRISRHDPNGV